MIHTYESVLDNAFLSLPIRSTLVREGDRGILFSPIPFTPAQVTEIRSLGGVTDIVAPCLLHHLSVPSAMQLFPEARVWGVPGFEQKRPDIKWTHIISKSNWMHGDILDTVMLDGAPQLNEIEFFHKSTRTLISMDLCFNMRRPGGWGAPILLRLVGTYNSFAVSRLLKLMIKDKAALRKTLHEVLAWDIDRIIPGHGEIVPSGGRVLLEKGLRDRGLF